MRAYCWNHVTSFSLLAFTFVGSTLGSATGAAQTAVAPPDLTRPKTLLGPAPPYVPRATDYGFEIGLQAGRSDMIWIGGLVGLHSGRCLFTESETCQQYVDMIGGAALREAETTGLYLASLRWQFVNFPDRYSPFFRVMGGMSQIKRPDEIGWRPTAGVGFGVTTYLHRRFDLRLEGRLGATDHVFGQGLLSFQLKTDRLLEIFATRLRDLGHGAVDTAIEATGTAIKATGEGIEAIGEGVSSPFRKDKPTSSPAPTKSHSDE